MGAQWDRAGGRARVPRAADLAPFAVRPPLLFFLPGQLVLVALGAYWIAILGLLCSPLVSFFIAFILHAILAFIIPPSQYHQQPSRFHLRTHVPPHHERTITHKHDRPVHCVHHRCVAFLSLLFRSQCSTDREHVTFFSHTNQQLWQTLAVFILYGARCV